MITLIDIKLERQEAPLGVAILSVKFQREDGQQAGYQWPINLGVSPQQLASELGTMAFGIRDTFK